MKAKKGWIKAGLFYTTAIAFVCASTQPSQPSTGTQPVPQQNGNNNNNSGTQPQNGNNNNSGTQLPTFYTKTLGKNLVNQINAMDLAIGKTISQSNPSWQKAYQLVMQNLNSLSVNDPTYGSYLETASNMLTLIPVLINSNGSFQPYNPTWSLIQGKDGTLYNVDGTVATNVARTMTAAQVNEILNKMIDLNVRFGQMLAQIDPNLSNAVMQIYMILSNSKPTDPFYSDYAEIALNQINCVPMMVQSQGQLRPGNIRWSNLVDAQGNAYNWDGTPKQQKTQSPGKKLMDQIIQMDLSINQQITKLNPNWRVAYYKTYSILKTLPETDPFYSVYMKMGQNQLSAIPVLLKNQQFQPSDVLWSLLKDSTNNLYDFTLTKQPSIAQDKMNTVKNLMNQLVQLDIDYSDRILKINTGWRDSYTGVFGLLQGWIQNSTANGYQDPFIDTYVQAAQNQITAIPILVKAGGSLYPTPQNFAWTQFQDSRGGTYDIQSLAKISS